MSRLQKKSVVASVTGHILLLALLFVGPAFLVVKYEPGGASKNKPPETTITVLPNQRVERTLHNADTPHSESSESPQPPGQTARKPSARTANRWPKVDISNPLIRSRSEYRKSIQDGESSEGMANRAAQVNEVLETIRKQSSTQGRSSPIIPEGRPVVDYQNLVEAVYENAWLPPDGLADDSVAVRVSVTVSRNGAVSSYQVLRLSGVFALDTSIAAVLDRVKAIGQPFPASDQATQRMFIINFHLKAKRTLE
ncbi:MAG: TonB C-terminal domain-containing protein [Verrucomicrobia bacterium]|nr:TonB C-terminal domain-containing protein [Verrucomicrobiota bacterium]